MTFITPLELWKSLGSDAYTKVRAEAVGTGNGTTSAWSLDKDNVISASDTLYDTGTASTTYTIDLDDGEITTLTASAAVTADYSYAEIPDSFVQELLKRADAELTESTGRIFATTSVVEYIDVEDVNADEYFLSNYPVITISSMQVNTESNQDTPSWSSSTQGLGEDFIANSSDLKIGRFRWIDNFPTAKGGDKIKVTYTTGFTSTPERVKELATLLATRQMISSTVYRSIFMGRDNFSPVRLEEIENRIAELTRQLKKLNIERP